MDHAEVLQRSGIALGVFLIAVPAAVDFIGFVSEIEDRWQLLFDGRDAPWVVASDDSGDLLGKFKTSLLNDLTVLYYVDRDIVVDISKYIEVE